MAEDNQDTEESGHSAAMNSPDWDEALVVMEHLRKVFYQSKDKGEATFTVFNALCHSFIITTRLNPHFPKNEDMQRIYPVPVPLWALEHLVAAISTYGDADRGKTFGEVLGIEGGGQGRQRTKDRLATRMVRRQLALSVEALRRHHEAAGRKEEAKLVNIYAEIAEHTSYSVDYIEKAYKRHRKKLRPAKA